jgi:hypothetical protein
LIQEVTETKNGQLHRVNSWYGLTGEVDVENELWHLVEEAGVLLQYLPLENLLIRRGFLLEGRLCLSYLHEFGHF